MFSPSRRDLMAITATGLLLPRGALAASMVPVPVIPPFIPEDAAVRDQRFGRGTGSDARASLPLGANNKRIWLDTQATSASGDGRSAATAFNSEASAYAALRGGDQLMIASGSVITRPLGQLMNYSGPSIVTPTVIQSYDRAAPTNESHHGRLTNRVTYLGATPFAFSTSRAPASNIALRGIRFDHGAASQGLEYAFTSGIDGLLIEQCAFIAAQLSLNCTYGTKTHVIRQSAFQGQWNSAGRAQGVYTSSNYDTVIEDCIFFHCGWKMGVSRSASAAAGGPTIYSHGLYAQVTSGGVLRRCIFVEPSSHGAQLRGNWHSHDNAFVSCPLALLHGGGTTYAVSAPKGVMAACYRNVVTTAQQITPSAQRGIGIGVENTRAGSFVEQNLLVGPGALRAGAALSASAHAGVGYAPNPTLVTFARNTNMWTAAGYDQGPGGKSGWPGRVFVTSADNLAIADKTKFVSSARDGVSAAKACGFASISDLGYGAAADPTQPWAIRIANHLKRGFTPVGVTVTPGVAFRGAVLPDGSWNAS